MYKALIADDEEIIRSGLSRLLARDPDFEVAALAEDGEQALELAAERLPDLLLVDINMPFLNGLEFIERLEGVLRGAVIIVITGYDDFSYAQQALRLGVFDYLLKPVMEDAFYDAVGRAKQQLQTNRRQVKYLDWARMQLEKNRSSLVAAFLDGWLEGRYSEPEVAEQLGYLGISIPEPYGVTVAHLSVNEGKTMVGQEWDENLLYYAAENIARELRELLEEHLPAQAVLSQVPGDRLAGLPEAYDDAMELLEQREKCPQSVLEARRYIEERYADPCLSLQGAADRLHLSPQHLSRLFRHETGVTFVDYLSRVRIRRAVELLADGELKMYEIAERVGYSSQHYFSSAFKKVLGVSPMEYRRGGAAR